MAGFNDAITQLESSFTAYQNAAQTTTNDAANVTAIQAKLDAANATVTSDTQAQTAAATAFNGACDAASAAILAAKVPVTTV